MKNRNFESFPNSHCICSGDWIVIAQVVLVSGENQTVSVTNGPHEQFFLKTKQGN